MISTMIMEELSTLMIFDLLFFNSFKHFSFRKRVNEEFLNLLIKTFYYFWYMKNSTIHFNIGKNDFIERSLLENSFWNVILWKIDN